MWRAALRRLVVLFVLLFVGITLGSLLLGLLFGAGAQRSVSLGFAVVGCFLLVTGFFVGSRGPVRLIRRERGEVSGARMADPDERVEAINVSAMFVAVGFVLVVIGVALDPRYRMI